MLILVFIIIIANNMIIIIPTITIIIITTITAIIITNQSNMMEMMIRHLHHISKTNIIYLSTELSVITPMVHYVLKDVSFLRFRHHINDLFLAGFLHVLVT
jgi:hypothetical protein